MSERRSHPPQYTRRHSITRFKELRPTSTNDNDKDKQKKPKRLRFAAYPALAIKNKKRA